MARIIKNIIGVVERLLFFLPRSSGGIYVINYHGTPKSVLNNFEQHLDYYSRHFHILDPAGFEDICEKQKYPVTSKPMLLLTFDDGMRSNVNALQLFRERKIKAFFFIIPAFIESGNPQEYLSKVIRPGYVNKKETEQEDFMPMGWETLHEVLENGHKIGSHTYSHTLLKEDDEEKSTFEIAGSREFIEKHLSIEVPYFCSINNTSISIGDVQENIIGKCYKYHFTTFYGNNVPKPHPGRIERINIEAYWNINEVRFALGNIRRILIKK